MGTSAGALAGSLYCAGYTPREVRRGLAALQSTAPPATSPHADARPTQTEVPPTVTLLAAGPTPSPHFSSPPPTPNSPQPWLHNHARAHRSPRCCRATRPSRCCAPPPPLGSPSAGASFRWRASSRGSGTCCHQPLRRWAGSLRVRFAGGPAVWPAFFSAKGF